MSVLAETKKAAVIQEMKWKVEEGERRLKEKTAVRLKCADKFYYSFIIFYSCFFNFSFLPLTFWFLFQRLFFSSYLHLPHPSFSFLCWFLTIFYYYFPSLSLFFQSLETPIEGTDTELLNLIKNFESEMHVRSERLIDLQKVVDICNRYVRTYVCVKVVVLKI